MVTWARFGKEQLSPSHLALMIEPRGGVATKRYFGVDQTVIIRTCLFEGGGGYGAVAQSQLQNEFFPVCQTACTTPSTSTHWPSSAPLSSAAKVTLGAVAGKRDLPISCALLAETMGA